MNKRLKLFYRGQTKPSLPVPSMFRDGWRRGQVRIGKKNWRKFWNELERIGESLYGMLHPRVDSKLSAPRWRGLRDVREARWAVIQHYGLWPTPLIDVTTNLRIAASFAMDNKAAKGGETREGYVYVLGMPSEAGSITFDLDQQMVLARLAAVCPPAARRPHFQDGFLVGRFPMDVSESYGEERLERLVNKSTVAYRSVAVLKLVDRGDFWSGDFPVIGHLAVYPDEDPLEMALADLKDGCWNRAQEYGSDPGELLSCRPRGGKPCACGKRS
jgi:hypothetical protein